MSKEAINAALDKKAENARELGLDYEPAQQEPVAWGIIASNTGRICQVELDADEVEGHNPKHIVPLYTTPQPAQQEPVAWRIRCTDPARDWTLMYRHPTTEEQFSNMEIQPLYTTPPQRTWVGLTDEEHMVLYTKADSGLHDWARAIEAKLKEKNT